MTNDDFDMALQNLVDHYENKRVLVSSQLKTHFNLHFILKESGPSIKSLQRTINDYITNLSLLGIETNNWDIIFVYLCSTKLPEYSLVFCGAVSRALHSPTQVEQHISDIIGSHNFTQSVVRNDSQGIVKQKHLRNIFYK